MQKSRIKRLTCHKNKTHGIVLIWMTLSLTALLIVAALATDVSLWYSRRADAQKTADAAALAGGYWLSKGASVATATQKAIAIATTNGYPTPVITSPYLGHAEWFHVYLSRTDPTIFAGVFGNTRQTIGAGSTSEAVTPLVIPFDPSYYGRVDGPINYSVLGPDNGTTRGDALSTRYIAIDGSLAGVGPTDINPLYDNYGKPGYDFTINVPSNYDTQNGTSQVNVQVFDPDTYDGGTNPWGKFDELHGPSPTEKWRFTLYSDNGTPGYNADDTQIATMVYGEGDSSQASTNNMWVTPTGFTFNLDTLRATNPNVNFRINVRSDNGSWNPGSGLDENGFLFRAGPPHNANLDNPANNVTVSIYNPATGKSSSVTESANLAWYDLYGPGNHQGPNGTAQNGTTMASAQYTSINFKNAGTGQLLLGYVPQNPNGETMTLIIHSFDMDTGGVRVWYTCTAYPGQTFDGIMSSNGTWSAPGSPSPATSFVGPTNSIILPASYPGGTWTAWYQSGASDNTTWYWEVANLPTTTRSHVRLISTGIGKMD